MEPLNTSYEKSQIGSAVAGIVVASLSIIVALWGYLAIKCTREQVSVSREQVFFARQAEMREMAKIKLSMSDDDWAKFLKEMAALEPVFIAEPSSNRLAAALLRQFLALTPNTNETASDEQENSTAQDASAPPVPSIPPLAPVAAFKTSEIFSISTSGQRRRHNRTSDMEAHAGE